MGLSTAISNGPANDAFKDWQIHSDAPRTSTGTAILTSLRRRYPEWTVTVTPSKSDLIAFAEAGNAQAKLDTESENFSAFRVHKNPKGRDTGIEGSIQDKVMFGKYDYTWNGQHFLVYSAQWLEDFRPLSFYFVLHKRDIEGKSGSQPKAVDELIAASSRWGHDLHEEVYVFDQQEWVKNKELYKSVQEAKWDDVILYHEMKEALITDVEGFFDCKDDYKEFAVPWKRGVIFHGLPGNGKTCSIKALMHALSIRPNPIPTLYVKSLAGCNNDYYAIREIFTKARDSSPCLLVFEDLDSLIKDNVKSFFLNEVDGLEDNNGIMMIGSTNYLERLDAGISKRPSRFDRKYHFVLPERTERVQYCHYWRSKLANNDKVDFPAQLSDAIADATDGFSFAYLKEAFITSLLMIVGAHRGSSKEIDGLPETDGEAGELEHVLLWRVISKQVQTLRDQMEGARKSAEEAAKSGEDGGACLPPMLRRMMMKQKEDSDDD